MNLGLGGRLVPVVLWARSDPAIFSFMNWGKTQYDDIFISIYFIMLDHWQYICVQFVDHLKKFDIFQFMKSEKKNYDTKKNIYNYIHTSIFVPIFLFTYSELPLDTRTWMNFWHFTLTESSMILPKTRPFRTNHLLVLRITIHRFYKTNDDIILWNLHTLLSFVGDVEHLLTL